MMAKRERRHTVYLLLNLSEKLSALPLLCSLFLAKSNKSASILQLSSKFIYFFLYLIYMFKVASKLYEVNATIIIFVFVLYCI